jgi:hypothetical protein
MIVELIEFDMARKYLKEINNTDIDDIVWVRNGVQQDIPEEILDEWKFIGLSNTDFPKFAGLSEYGVGITTMILSKKE